MVSQNNHSRPASLALIELLDSLYSHIDKQDIVLGMYFDLQKAFGTADHEILLHNGISVYNYGDR